MKNASLLLAFLLMTILAVAQTTDPGWQAVKQHLGQRVEISTLDGKAALGTLTAVDEQSATIDVNGKTTSFDQQKVQRIYLVKKTSRTKTTLIGLAVGAGTGAVIGAAAASPCDRNNSCFLSISRGQGAAIVAVPGAVIGAGVGALVGGRTHKTLIYDRAATSPAK